MIQLLGGLGAGLAIMLALSAWKLSSGPISLAFLTPYIESALNRNFQSFRIRLDDTILTWAGWERTLDFRVLEARLIGGNGDVIARAPELSLSLSARALMEGLVAPKTIELFRPKLRLVHLRDGGIEVGFSEGKGSSGKLAEGLIAEFLANPDPTSVTGYLKRVSVIDADLFIEDQRLETTWESPSTRVSLWRDADGIKGEVSLEPEVEGKKAQIDILGDYKTKERRFDLGVSFKDLSPAVFSNLDPGLKPFDAFDLPLEGTATLSMGVDGVVESVGFDLTGGGGRLILPAPLEQKLNVGKLRLKGRFDGSTERLEIDDLFVDVVDGSNLVLPASHGYKMSLKSVLARGSYDAAIGALDIKDLSVDLGPKGVLVMPAPTNHTMPMKTVHASGRYIINAKRLEVTSLRADLHGPSATLSATVDGIGGKMAIDAKGVLFDMPVDEFARYWPRAWGTDTQQWCVANLSDGIVREARANIHMRSDAKGGFQVVSLTGGMDLEGVTVDYLHPMPKVTKANGAIKFSKQRFDIFISQGESGDLKLRKGTLFITGLDKKDQHMDIELLADGPVRTVLELIDHEPLGFTTALGLNPAKTGGRASVKLDLGFILEHAVSKDKVKVAAVSELLDVTVADAVLGHDISSGRLDLRVDNRGMDVSGQIKIGDIPATLAWRENFDDKSAFRSRYDLFGSILNVNEIGDLGIDLGAFSGDFIKGSIGAEAHVTVFDGDRSRLDVKADLTDVSLSFPTLGWFKKKGVGGTAVAEIDLSRDLISKIPRFVIAAGDLLLKGSALYAANGAGLERINLDRIAYGRTDMKGAMIPADDGSWTLSFHGASLDLEPMFSDIFKDDPGEGGEGGLRFSLSADLDRVWLGREKFLKRVSGTFARDGNRWRRMVLSSLVGEDRGFKVTIAPGAKGNRTLSIRSDDAASVLKTFGFYDNMVEGGLDISGEFDDNAPGAPLKGKVMITDYRIIKAPTLVKLLSVLALTGILESLQNEGLHFATLEAPFTLGNGVLDITDAKATGITLGYTASGRIYTQSESVDLKGTVVPAYAINSFMGVLDKIPVLGKIFTGEEKGGGIFAASYKMKGPIDKPEVEVSPLSMLAPGIFRKLYGLFEDEVRKLDVLIPKSDDPKPENPKPKNEDGAKGK